MRLHPVSEMMHVDDGAGYAGIRQRIEPVIDHRFSGHRHQRFRHRIGDRPQARAKPGGKHDGLREWNQSHHRKPYL
ncbi:hypothetical protein D3C80_1065020 [compost metagenome]